jgi:hypothetical protein
MKASSWIMLTALLLVGGCHRAEPLVSPALKMATMASVSPEQRRDKSLAYEHTVTIALEPAVLPNRMKEIQEACATDKTYGCTLLDVSLRSTTDAPSGTIRMRLAPGGVAVFTATASKNGAIKEQITHAEDLAQQVNDTERELALLTAHRDRLIEFSKDKSLKIDQVMTVSRELASVQTQIDTAATTRANLHRRIDTELLTLNLNVPAETLSAQRAPIRDAVESFTSDFGDAIAQVIRFIAGLIPWLVVIVPGIVLLRLLWHAVSRWLSRRPG